MENSHISDTRFIKPLNKLSNKNFFHHKQIGFFDDKLLIKNIDHLKNDLTNTEDFLKTFSSMNKCNDDNTKIATIRIRNDLENKEKEIINKEFLLINNKLEEKKKNEKLVKSNKKTDFKDKGKLNNSKKKLGELENREKSRKSLLKNKILGSDSNLISSLTIKPIKGNFNTDKKDIQKIKVIQILNINKKRENSGDIISEDNKNNSINSSNLIKNKIISNHLNKENNKDKASDTSSLKEICKRVLPTKPKEEGKKTINIKKDDLSENFFGDRSMDLNHISFYTNNIRQKLQNSPKKDIIDSKIDFFYKKIFDKKTRVIFNNKHPPENMGAKKKPENNSDDNFSSEYFYNKFGCGFKKREYIEDKIIDIKRKIFFIKGVYDFSYPKIVVNKFKSKQNFFNNHHSENKLKLMDPMNNTSHKFFEKYEEKLKTVTEDFRKLFYIKKLNTSSSIKNEKEENLKETDEDKENIFRSTFNIGLKSLKKPKLTLSNRLLTADDKDAPRTINPINIQTFYPDLGVPSKLKVIHKSKIL